MTREEAINLIADMDSDKYTAKEAVALTMAIKALEQEHIEVEATKLQMAYNQGFEDCRKAVLEAMYELCDEGGTLKENPWRDNPHINAITDAINNLPSVNPQEPKYCDRNICIKNEYNGIGCDDTWKQARQEWESEE